MYHQQRFLPRASFAFTAILLAAIAAVLVSACVTPTRIDPAASESMAIGAVASATVSGADSVSPPSAAVANRGIRVAEPQEAEWAREERMRINEVFAFFGIQPGMTILDLYSANNYYLETLSEVVGNQGSIIVYDKPPHRRMAEDDIAIRSAVGRPGNVTFLSGRAKELNLPRGAYDAVLMVLVYHDLYIVNNDTGWTPVDRPRAMATIYESMKPGSVLGIIDYAAATGAPASTAGELHRIDPGLIRKDVTAAGFLFDGEIDALRNYSDDLEQPVFGESFRRRADRVVLRFRKPVAGR